MNNFTRSKGNAYWHAITNLTCCSIDLKRMQLFKTFLVLMLFAFSSTSMFAQNRTTFYEVCLADRPEGLTEEQAVALFPNAECDGTLTTVKTENLQGTDCGWVSTYTYELFCDDKSLGLEEKLVYEGGDLEAPKLEVPADVTVECDNIPAVGTPTATDNCDDDVEITYDGEIRIGDDDCLYQLQRTWTATDNCGLTTTLSQTITVQDTKGPELNKGAKVPTGETGLNVCYDQRPDGPSADYIASLFSDNCGDVKVEKEPVFKGTDCMWKGYINYYITDSCGNPGDTITLYYNGGDTEAPVFVDPPADITVSCIDQIPANYALAWTDNCSVSDPKSKNIGVDDTSELGEACQGGVMTRTWEAQDACGNKVTHTQTITVEPAPPVAFDEIADLEIKCEELASFEAGQLYYSNGGSGACDISGYAQGVAEDFSDNCGSFTVTYTYNDTCNSLEYVQTVTVIDDVKPELIIPADVTVQCDAVPGLGEVSASDNCDTNVEIKYDGEVRTDGNCADSYTLTRT